MTRSAFRALFLCAVIGAVAVRTVRLDLRPMHADEANQAVKFGALLERGDYRFDPQDHHGPTLYYLTLPAARLAGARTLAGLDERTLRLVPALFGAALVLAFLLFAGGLSRSATLAAAVLAAASPALTYYSRFYIQETLLAAFLVLLLGAGWRYSRRRSLAWALLAGVAAGLMAATKETSLILFGGTAVAFGLLTLIGSVGTRRRGVVPSGDGWVWRDTRTKFPSAFHALAFAAAAAVVVVLFYTSFFKNPGGLADAARAVGASVARAGSPGVHAHPWSWYFQILAWSRTAGNLVWSEGFLLLLALAGAVAALVSAPDSESNPRFVRFVLFFTVTVAAVFSLIPYKTPWNMLTFYVGLVILAGHGVEVLLRLARPRALKAVAVGVVVIGLAFQAFQAYRANFVQAADPANPYVYAQTVPDFLRLVAAVERAAADAPENTDMLVEVVAPPDETWPLPWYLRSFGRVGYWTDPAAARRDVPAGQAGAVIVAAAFSDEVGAELGQAYRPSFYGLRPEVVLSLFTREPR